MADQLTVAKRDQARRWRLFAGVPLLICSCANLFYLGTPVAKYWRLGFGAFAVLNLAVAVYFRHSRPVKAGNLQVLK